MTQTPAWQNLCIELKESDALILLACMKKYKTQKSQRKFCTLWAQPTPHLMRYKLLVCRCPQCEAAAPYASCPWRSKMLSCLDRKVVSLFESGVHVTSAKPPRRLELTEAHKEFARQMARGGMKLARIRTAMLQQFSLQPSELPVLLKVQKFVGYYRRTKLGGSDTSATIPALVRSRAFKGREDEHEPFSFGWEYDENGDISVGNGSDEKPFLMGFSSKALLRQCDRDAASFIFHADATYKTNQVGYPVLVCGISDATRKFHLVALFIMSQQQEPHFTKAFAALRWVYHQVVGKALLVEYFMGDADCAEFNAVATVFGADCNYVHLMCFYHLIANVV